MMRPQDVVVMLKMLANAETIASMTAIAESLCISQSEVSGALERCRTAKLVDDSKKHLNLLALRDFLVSGLQYVFPAIIGPIVHGVPTYISASPIMEMVSADGESYVWQNKKGSSRGSSIIPLYITVPEAVQKDAELYKLLVIADTLRIGKTREREVALRELDKYLKQYADNQY